MKHKFMIIALLVISFGCAANKEGTQFPYVFRQLRFYNEFAVGDNQLLKINNSDMRVEYSVTKEDRIKGGYYVAGKFYADKPRTGGVGVAIMDSDWNIVAHIPGNLYPEASSPTVGAPFSAYINPDVYDVSKFKYMAFGIKE